MTLTTTDPETDLVTSPEEPERLSFRQRARRHPRWGRAYRVGVGVVGVLMMIGAILLGPFPGPGGVPLFLLGIAVLATEFSWARRFHQKMTDFYHRYLGWPRNQRITFWVLFAAAVGLFWYISLILIGVPGWMPNGVARLLVFLPGVSA